MSKRSKPTSQDSSWRTIKQSSTRRAITPVAKERRLRLNLRYCRYALMGLLLLGGVVAGLGWWRHHALKAFAAKDHPLTHVYFKSDGVLDETWFAESIEIPSAHDLMEVDIFALRDAILEQGQVKQVEVRRLFPDALSVTVNEYQPILKVVTVDAQGERVLHLVSEEGTIFSGQRYAKATLRGLPFIDGVVLKRSDSGFQPLPQAQALAELLNLARTQWPEFYADWQVVSCRDFDGDTEELGSLIHVRSAKYGELIFAPTHFAEQMSRLSQIVEYAQQEQLPPLTQIDLSLPEPVIRFAKGRRFRRR